MKSPNIVIDYVVSSIGRIGMDGLSVNKGCGAGPCYLLHINIFIYRPTQPAHHELFSWNKGSGGQCSWTLTTGTNQSSWEIKFFLKLQNKGSGGALFLWRLVAISNQNHPRSQMCGKKPFNRVFNALLSDIDCWPGQQKHNAHFAMLNAQSSMCNCAMLMHWQHQFTKETEGTHNFQLFSNGINRFIVTKKDVQFWLLSRDQVLNLTESHLQFSGRQSILGRKRAICKVPIWVVSGPLIPPVSTSRPPDPPWKRYK